MGAETRYTPQEYHEPPTVLSIPEHAFRNSPDFVERTAERMLDQYEIDPTLFESDPLRRVLTLALADEWLSDNRESKRATVVRVLYAMTRGNSGYILQNGTEQSVGLGERKDYSYDEYIEKYLNEDLTQHIRSIATDWTEGSELETARRTLGVTPENEKAIETFVLNRSSLELGNELGQGGGAFRVGQRIFLPANYMNYKYFDHEYAHCQSDGLTPGYKGLVFMYLNEAVTESVTNIPTTYPKQREVLDMICASIPGLRTDTINAYMGDNNARIGMVSKITNRYGLDGLLAIARLGSEIMHEQSEEAIENSVHVPPKTVIDLFEKKDRDRFVGDRISA